MTRTVPGDKVGAIVEELLVTLLNVDLAHASLQIRCDGGQLTIRPLPGPAAAGGTGHASEVDEPRRGDLWRGAADA